MIPVFIMASAYREAVIYFDFFRGRQNETVVKELCVASAIASETFRSRAPTRGRIMVYLGTA